ncbi:MAG: B12-binding domain-containing radical SAM protein, partial [bacterium]
MNVILINVPFGKVYSLIGKNIIKSPPINLASIAAYLRENGHDVSIIETVADEIKLQDLDSYLNRPFDVVGVSSMTPS